MQGFTQSRYTTKTAPEGYLDTLRQSCEVKIWKWHRIYYRKKKTKQLRLEVPTKKHVKKVIEKRHPIYGTLRLLRNLLRLSVFVITTCYFIQYAYIRPIKPISGFVKENFNPVRFTEEELKAFYAGEKYEAQAKELPVTVVTLEPRSPIKVEAEIKPEVKPIIAKSEVEKLIVKYFGDDAEMALKIAKCESGFNEKAKNKTSTASGVFQILSGTWISNRKAMGLSTNLNLRFNAEENIKTAKYIHSRRNWQPWECRKLVN